MLARRGIAIVPPRTRRLLRRALPLIISDGGRRPKPGRSASSRRSRRQIVTPRSKPFLSLRRGRHRAHRGLSAPAGGCARLEGTRDGLCRKSAGFLCAGGTSLPAIPPYASVLPRTRYAPCSMGCGNLVRGEAQLRAAGIRCCPTFPKAISVAALRAATAHPAAGNCGCAAGAKTRQYCAARSRRHRVTPTSVA